MIKSTIDMLIKIKNAQATKHEHVSVSYSKAKFDIANILKESGFLNNIERKTKKGKKSEHDYLFLQLKYADGQGSLNGLRILSKPSRRVYIKAEDIKPVRSGYGISVISTSKGIMSSVEAKKQNLGGELLFEIW